VSAWYRYAHHPVPDVVRTDEATVAPLREFAADTTD
jgi:hypothetical protein